jgi:hypothetical protein
LTFKFYVSNTSAYYAKASVTINKATSKKATLIFPQIFVSDYLESLFRNFEDNFFSKQWWDFLARKCK